MIKQSKNSDQLQTVGVIPTRAHYGGYDKRISKHERKNKGRHKGQDSTMIGRGSTGSMHRKYEDEMSEKYNIERENSIRDIARNGHLNKVDSNNIHDKKERTELQNNRSYSHEGDRYNDRHGSIESDRSRGGYGQADVSQRQQPMPESEYMTVYGNTLVSSHDDGSDHVDRYVHDQTEERGHVQKHKHHKKDDKDHADRYKHGLKDHRGHIEKHKYGQNGQRDNTEKHMHIPKDYMDNDGKHKRGRQDKMHNVEKGKHDKKDRSEEKENSSRSPDRKSRQPQKKHSSKGEKHKKGVEEPGGEGYIVYTSDRHVTRSRRKSGERKGGRDSRSYSGRSKRNSRNHSGERQGGKHSHYAEERMSRGRGRGHSGEGNVRKHSHHTEERMGRNHSGERMQRRSRSHSGERIGRMSRRHSGENEGRRDSKDHSGERYGRRESSGHSGEMEGRRDSRSHSGEMEGRRESRCNSGEIEGRRDSRSHSGEMEGRRESRSNSGEMEGRRRGHSVKRKDKYNNTHSVERSNIMGRSNSRDRHGTRSRNSSGEIHCKRHSGERDSRSRNRSGRSDRGHLGHSDNKYSNTGRHHDADRKIDRGHHLVAGSAAPGVTKRTTQHVKRQSGDATARGGRTDRYENWEIKKGVPIADFGTYYTQRMKEDVPFQEEYKVRDIHPYTV